MFLFTRKSPSFILNNDFPYFEHLVFQKVDRWSRFLKNVSNKKFLKESFTYISYTLMTQLR
jgi:hypothetical protein